MNCSDIRDVLNQHALRSLSAAERREFDVHVAGCATCFGAVSADRLLGSEVMDRPREGLSESILVRISESGRPSSRPSAPFGWPSIAAGIRAAP